MASLMDSEYKVGTIHRVKVSHINNPHSFFVRPSLRILKEHNIELATLESYEGNVDPSEVHVGKIIVFKSCDGITYLRGKIIFVEGANMEMKCDIFAIDTGALEKSVPVNNIHHRSVPKDILPLATHCQLADCKPRSEDFFSEDAIDAMKYFVGDELAQMTIREKSSGKLLVELANSNPDDIATMLAFTNYTVLGYNCHNISRLNISEAKVVKPYTFKNLKAGDVLHVQVQSGTALNAFYVADVIDYKVYNQFKRDLVNFHRTEKVIDPKKIAVNLPVVALVDECERAIIKKITIPETKVLVQLVDWGKELELNVSKIKPLKEYFLEFPVTVIFCSTNEDQTWDNGLPMFLYPGFQFVINVKRVGKQFDLPYKVNIIRK